MSSAESNGITGKITKWGLDSWSNALSGLNILGKDKKVSAIAVYNKLGQGEIEHTYASDDIYSKIVDIPAEDMVREGFKVTVKDQNSQEINDGIQTYLEEREGKVAIAEALSWGRLYGGAGIVMGIDDGLKSEEPVNENNIRGIDFFNVLNKYELHPQAINRNPESKRFGMPETYSLQPQGGGEFNVVIHWTRVLRFSGHKLPRNLFIENNYWDASTLIKTKNAIRNFQTSHDSVASVMQDFAQAVFKIKGLTEMVAQGKEGLLQKRLAMIDSMRSAVKAIVIEEDEEFDRKMTSLAGVKDVLEMINKRVVTATDGIPHTILLGESPSGLGATGNSEIRDYYDLIARRQEKNLKPQLEMLLRYILKAGDGPTKGKEPSNWNIEFNPLWQMSEKESAEIRKAQAETDEKYILNGVLSGEEVRESRFGGTEYSTDTNLMSVELEERTLGLPSPKDEKLIADYHKDFFDLSENSHSHKDTDNTFLSPAISSGDGKHFHWDKEYGTWSTEDDSPDHTHKNLATGVDSQGPEKIKGHPDLIGKE